MTPDGSDVEARAAPRKPSVAIIVDTHIQWLVSRIQPTGIPRFILGLLEIAPSREDVDGWAAETTADQGSSVPIVRIGAEELDRLTRARKAGVAWRTLGTLRDVVKSFPIEGRLRAVAKQAYRRVALRVTGNTLGYETPLGRPDVVVIPTWNAAPVDRIQAIAAAGIPVRLVVHDLFPIRNPEWFSPESAAAFREVLDGIAPVLDRAVALSNQVARHWAELYPNLAGRVRVGTPTIAVGSPRMDDAGRQRLVDAPYLLVLATVEPRKNHRVILDAWRLAIADAAVRATRLVIAGSRGWLANDLEAEIARDAGSLGLVRFDRVTDPEASVLYRDCLATIHASWAEGYGTPVRESIARGIPTLVSTTIPQDGLNPSWFLPFEPTDATGLARLIQDVVSQGFVRQLVTIPSGNGWEPVFDALVEEP